MLLFSALTTVFFLLFFRSYWLLKNAFFCFPVRIYICKQSLIFNEYKGIGSYLPVYFWEVKFVLFCKYVSNLCSTLDWFQFEQKCLEFCYSLITSVANPLMWNCFHKCSLQKWSYNVHIWKNRITETCEEFVSLLTNLSILQALRRSITKKLWLTP